MSIDKDNIQDLSKEELIQKYTQMKLSRDRVFAIASHDLRSPFGGLLGISEMLSTNAATFSPEDLTEYMETFHESLQNIYNLLENLFEWGRIERNKIERAVEQIPFKLVFEEILDRIDPIISDKEIKINHDYDPEQIITGNSKMIEFIIKNFLVNAVKYSARGSDVVVRCLKNGEQDEIQVIDRGIGISAENQNKLFKAEVSWKMHGTEGEPGTGIGLLVSNQYADYFGAEIRIKSAEKEGSTFSLILPALPV